MHFSSPEKRIWLVTDAYAIVVSLQAPIYLRFLALVSWSWVVMNHKRVYSQENARMHFPRPEKCIWWCCKHYSAVLSAGSLGVYNRKPLKIAENLLVFGVYNRKQSKIAENPLVFGVYN